MPPVRSTRRDAIPRSSARPTLLAAVLAGVVAALIASPHPQAAGGPDKTAPTAPGNLRLDAATETAVTVAWNPATDNVGVEGYRVAVGNGRYTRTAGTRYTQSGLTCGISYPVEVRAYDHVRNLSPPAQSVVATAPCLDTTPPTPPSNLQQIARTTTTATLAWTASSDNVAVVGYSLSRSGAEIDTTAETSYVYVGLQCGSTYSVGVRAYDVSSNYSSSVPYYLSTSPCGDVSAPSAPAGLVQTDRTQSSMSFAWSASTDNVGVARYLVYRDGTQVATTTALTYALSGLTCGIASTIGVEAVDVAGNRSPRTAVVMSTAPCSGPSTGGDTQPPSDPSNVSAGTATVSTIPLSWSPASDNVGVAGYDVYRDGVRVHVAPGTSYTFQGLSCGTSYRLGVAAFDAAGNRSGTVSVTAGTTACSDSSPPTTPGNLVLLSRTGTSVTVSWAASSDNVGVTGYGAYLDGSLAGSTAETTYTFTGLVCGTSRTFGIDAYDAAGNRSTRANVVLQTAACGDVQPPSTPTQLTVSGKTQTGATLSWAASSDNVAVAGYDVFVNGSKVATVTGTSSVVGSLTCNTAYTLGVEAFDTSGNRSSRATTSTTTEACSSPPPTSGGSTKYVSPSGSDSSTCTQSAPCQSFNRAWQLASPGDVVEVAGGSYPGQTLAPATKSGSALVVFRPAAGASVTLGGFTSGNRTTGAGAKHFELRDLKLTAYVSLQWGAEDVTLRSLDAPGFELNSAKNIRIYGGDWGPMVDGINHINSCGFPGCFASQDILIDGAYFHDYLLSDPEIHSECLMIWPGRRVTIRNSTFRNCTDFDVLVDPYNTAIAGSPGDLVFENNFFDEPMPGNEATVNCSPNCPRGSEALSFEQREGWSGVKVLYNSLLTDIQIDPGVTNVIVKGNVGRKSGSFFCQPGVAFSYNVWSGTKCSATDRTAALSTLFMGASSSDFDLHLKAGSAAIGAGDPGDFPSNDRDGEGRPQGAVDAGADERG